MATATAPHFQSPLSYSDVATVPRPGMVTPTAFAFAPDDSMLCFLYSPPEGPTHLYSCDTSDNTLGPMRVGVDLHQVLTGTSAQLSLEEQLRRERTRTSNVGVTSFSWTSKSSKEMRMLVPVQGGVCVTSPIIKNDGEKMDGVVGGGGGGSGGDDTGGGAGDAPSPQQLHVLSYKTGQAAIDPKFSPDGNWVGFVRDRELCVVSTHPIGVDGGYVERQLTTGSTPTRSFGLAEFAAQEELSRFDGFWWDPTSTMIAMCLVEEESIPLLTIPHIAHDTQGVPCPTETHRYPFAGKDNAVVKLGIVKIDGSAEPTWTNIDTSVNDTYISRVAWLPDASLCVHVLSRDQTTLTLVRIDVPTNQTSVMLEEKSDSWVNVSEIFHPLKLDASGSWPGFIWSSERSGYRHLYVISAAGDVRQLTCGEWVVDALCGVDEERGMVWFVCNKDSPTERQLYATSLNAGGDGQVTRVTREPGTHHVTINHACTVFVDVHSSVQTPVHVNVCRLHDASVIAALPLRPDPRLPPMDLTPPEMITLTSRDGDTLYGCMYRPPPPYAPPYVTVLSVYGGPHVQYVTNAWSLTSDLRCQQLSRHGFLVVKCDNRGSARRGVKFESRIKHAMGGVEVEDCEDVAAHLVHSGVARPKLGIFGWSYGGFLSAMCLARSPQVFQAAVAGAPVTLWREYDTCYTERYMGHPAVNERAYEQSSVMAHVHNIAGDILIVHGMIDENVHFRHSVRLISSLVLANKQHHICLLPGERHGLRTLEVRAYVEEKIVTFFKQTLLAAASALQ